MTRKLLIWGAVLILIASSFLLLPNYALKRVACAFPRVRSVDTIVIQPFCGMPTSEVTFLYNTLQKSYDQVKLNAEIPLPASAYYAPRNRYKADSLIAFLARRSVGNTIIVGLAYQDISTSKGNITDWGVMGLGYQPGRASVVSLHRLHRNNLTSQLYKVVIHELGHNFGIPHCTSTACYMRDAEGQNHFDEENHFCPACMNLMKCNGWK